MHLPKFPFIVLDTETTGFVPRVHRIIEYASVTVENGKVQKEYEQLFSIDEDIPPTVEVLTRIRTENLKGKPTIGEKAEEILAMISPETVIVGQNIPFDIRMLKGEGIDLSDHPWIDTSMLASIVFPELKSYSLGYMSEVLPLKHEPVHRALGDVHATLELFSKCWERLQQLTPKTRDIIHALALKGPEGYKKLFTAITETGSSPWLKMPIVETFQKTKDVNIEMAKHDASRVELIEESLDPTFIEDVLHTLVRRKNDTQYWVAVKNIEATVSRLDIPEDVSIVYPPHLVVNPEAVKSLLSQKSFNEDELTLAIKLYLYNPTKQIDLPIHGNEYAVWGGKVAAMYDSDSYKEYCDTVKNIVFVDHEQLLSRITADSLPKDTHVIIDDASMLEDTATKAYGSRCSIPLLRAAAEGNELLTKCTDLLQIWFEKTRSGTDLRYLTAADLQTPEVKGLRERLQDAKKSTDSEQIHASLDALLYIFDPKNLSGNITWIETYQNGDQYINAVPKNIATLLEETLYTTHPTTLLIPRKSDESLPAILPQKTKTALVPLNDALKRNLVMSYPDDWEMEEWITHAEGKSILLIASKRTIEDVYIKHAEMLEEKGIELFCQGLSGGLGRMQAQFAAAKAPAVLLMTPWMYEGIELPPSSVDHLLLHTLPFDHPAHAVLSRRAEAFANAFEQYSLPRLQHRLFRLLRSFFRHRTANGDVQILDKRIKTKSYGSTLHTYLNEFASEEAPVQPDATQQTLF